MPGGLLNIVSVGNGNVMLTGNPTKTFFKVTYSKYTNFGLQKFRLDFEGARDLRLTEESKFTFKIKRYADLLMDTYIVVTIPDIWSPIYPPSPETGHLWSAYDFRWIRDLGAQLVKSVEITCGSTTLQKYSGAYLAAMVERDFTAEKKELFHRMTGNMPEMYDPANTGGHNDSYPSAYYTANTAGAEPSIRGRTLYIPINTWFTLDSRCAFPLVSLQYNELTVNVTLRPIQQLFQVRDVFDNTNNFPYIQPDFTKERFQMYRFLQTPPAIDISTGAAAYSIQTKTWNADIHLLATYCFLSKEEAQLFAAEDQVYLVKDVFEYFFENVTGTTKSRLLTNGMVANWMFYLQRNDVALRNEWSNYTNWPYHSLPSNIYPAPTTVPKPTSLIPYGPLLNPNETATGYFITGDFAQHNQRDILQTLGILFDGEYRENTLVRGVYDYVEKYTRTAGAAKEGLYCYNFCLNTSPFDYQPSGAINMARFKLVELELATYVPIFDLVNSNFNIICDQNGAPIGVSNKSKWQLYEYNFNLTVFEERYNILSFISGNCGMLYAR
jgi:hypothetical protein